MVPVNSGCMFKRRLISSAPINACYLVRIYKKGRVGQQKRAAMFLREKRGQKRPNKFEKT